MKNDYCSPDCSSFELRALSRLLAASGNAGYLEEEEAERIID